MGARDENSPPPASAGNMAVSNIFALPSALLRNDRSSRDVSNLPDSLSPPRRQGTNLVTYLTEFFVCPTSQAGSTFLL